MSELTSFLTQSQSAVFFWKLSRAYQYHVHEPTQCHRQHIPSSVCQRTHSTPHSPGLKLQQIVQCVSNEEKKCRSQKEAKRSSSRGKFMSPPAVVQETAHQHVCPPAPPPKSCPTVDHGSGSTSRPDSALPTPRPRVDGPAGRFRCTLFMAEGAV